MKKLAVPAVVLVVVLVLLIGCGRREAGRTATEKPASVVEKSKTEAKPAEKAAADAKKPAEKTAEASLPVTPAAASAAASMPAKPTAKDILTRTAGVYKSLKSLEMDGSIFASMHIGKEVETSDGPVSLKYDRPNKVKLITGKDQHKVTVVCNGQNMYTYIAAEKMYQKTAAPKELSTSPQLGSDGFTTLNLLEGRDVGPYLSKAKLIGSEKLKGVDTYVVSHSVSTKEHGGASMTEKVWIGKSDFLIRQISTTRSISAAALNKMSGGKKKANGPLVVSQKTVVNKIAVNGRIPSSTFKFVPPAGAKEFKHPKPSDKPMEHPPVKPPDLSGKPAPAFSLPALDGDNVSLSDFKGSKPVLLVFWATLSKTGQQGATEINKVYDELKESDVAVVSISLDGDKETVTKFVDESKIAFPVLFGYDEAAKTAQSYGLVYLPTTFIIGKDGQIKSTIIGPEPVAKIKAELERLGYQQ